MTTLFVNACMRGEASRTLALCREYLERFDDVVEVDVAALDLKPFDADRVAYRTEKQRAGEWDDPIFSLSRQFAEADDIVIGVPYWDLSFPAAFKTYLEHVSVCELTFHYTEDARCEGICKAKRITYITTCGGFVEGANFGYEYIVGIAKMFGPHSRSPLRGGRGAGHRGHRRPGADGQGSRPDGETRLSESGKTYAGGPTVSRRSRFSHPEGFDDGLSIIAVSIMVQRALNCVDPRLVDHGLRVAAVLDAMLEAKGVTDPTQRRAAYLVALLHDVGAYRTEEIDRMVAFETESVWEHSFYGYLFFKELTPLGAYADVILYHHLPYDRFTDQDPYVKFLAGAVHVADRVDVLLLERPQADVVEVERLLAASRPGAFSPEAVALFFEAQRRFDEVSSLFDADGFNAETARAITRAPQFLGEPRRGEAARGGVRARDATSASRKSGPHHFLMRPRSLSIFPAPGQPSSRCALYLRVTRSSAGWSSSCRRRARTSRSTSPYGRISATTPARAWGSRGRAYAVCE